MPITFEINLDEEESRRLQSIFSFLPDYNQAEFLKRIAYCGAMDYKDQFLKDGSKNSVNELRQHRLFLLVQHVFDGLIPSEIEVASIFKISPSSARALIKNMRSRYYFEIEGFFKQTIRAILETVNNELLANGYFQIAIRSQFMVNEMNSVIEIRNRNCEKIRKFNPISSFYKISIASKTELETYINE